MRQAGPSARLAAIQLQGIAGGAMADRTFWHDLAEDFTRLAPAGGLCLHWQYTSGMPGHYRFWLGSNDPAHHETFRLKFEQLARRAGAAVDTSGRLDSLEAWQNELKKHDRDPRNQGDVFGPEVLDDGTRVYHQLGVIPNVCQASANRCMELEMKETEVELEQDDLAARGMAGEGSASSSLRATHGIGGESGVSGGAKSTPRAADAPSVGTEAGTSATSRSDNVHAQMPHTPDAQGPQEAHKAKKKPVRRHARYTKIDEALQEIADSRPRSQQEVFRALEGRVAFPPAGPFEAARGWIPGFRLDQSAARSWLSKRWAELDLPPLPRGPKNPQE
jgi:hypothetical protein